MTEVLCTVEGCERPLYAVGLCAGHYKRQQRGQSVDKPLRGPGRRDRVVAMRLNREEHEALKAAAGKECDVSTYARLLVEDWLVKMGFLKREP